MERGILLAGTKWLRKSLVVLISILTFGLVTPSNLTWLAEANTIKDVKDGALEEKEIPYIPIADIEEDSFNREQRIAELIEKAEANAYQKFGEKIQPKINDEFQTVILPKIEEAIVEIANQFPDEQLQQLTISKNPSGGRSEKIFHILNTESGEDLIRFHVRQDRIPLEGYWFNFHYHTYHDSFMTHYELGSIYWDTNTPPKWGSAKIVS